MKHSLGGIIRGMIGYIEGKVVCKENRLLILLAGGVGYTVFVTPEVAEHAVTGEQSRFWTHLSVKENALELYGFPQREELSFFRLLIGISGIGPKSALNIISLADIATIEHAIRRGDNSYLTKVSGIGKKLAEKIVLELKEKVGEMEDHGDSPRAEDEALEALEALGYAARDTREVVRLLAKKYTTAQDIIRKALQTLGGR